MPSKPRSSLVYTTDPEPQKPVAPPPEPAAANTGQVARISLDRKRRRGKTVTVIGGLRHNPTVLQELLRTLKQQCGAGGTLKDAELELQGDHRERAAAALTTLGYKVKLIGGG